jgi:hypothetical protein
MKANIIMKLIRLNIRTLQPLEMKPRKILAINISPIPRERRNIQAKIKERWVISGSPFRLDNFYGQKSRYLNPFAR